MNTRSIRGDLKGGARTIRIKLLAAAEAIDHVAHEHHRDDVIGEALNGICTIIDECIRQNDEMVERLVEALNETDEVKA